MKSTDIRISLLCVSHSVIVKSAYLLLSLSVFFSQSRRSTVSAQSIGYQPQFNFGFNPYLSPVFGYGLGLPFGAHNFSPSRYPFLLSSLGGGGGGGHGLGHFDGNGFMGKVHAKAFLKKLATSQYSLHPHSFKDKLNLIKHPEYAFTPYGAGYGYGKHYGAAMVANNPYKSPYGDYYDNGIHDNIKGAPLKTPEPPIKLAENDYLPSASHSMASYKLKPLLKLGALLTTAALIGKKVHEGPLIKLNPAGMILSETHP